ncbi:MAG: hypothetical protein H5T69_08350 [Chloroflexi bacterium]|nr:hypothetical protein [Chloroflexota bacterium]
MNITVQLDNVARVLSGRKEITISVEEGATGRDVLRALVAALPLLAQTTVDPAKGDFYSDEYWLAYEDRTGVPDLSAPLRVSDGSRLFILTGVC